MCNKAAGVIVKITRFEGALDQVDIVHQFDSFATATKFVVSKQDSYPDLGYDKHQVSVSLDGGTDWWGFRWDLQHPDNPSFRCGDYDLEHILLQVLKYAVFESRLLKEVDRVFAKNFLLQLEQMTEQ